MSNNTGYWDDRRGIIKTHKGGWEIGKGVTSHGYSLLDDLVGSAGFFQVMVLNVTGRLPSKELTQWMESTFMCLSWPDPRIWCNQIGALGGLSKSSPVSSICAGTLASDSKLYGPGTALTAAKFILDVFENVNQGATVEEYIENKAKIRGRLIVPGYARPIATGDERVTAMRRLAEELGFEEGKHTSLAFEIQSYLFEKYGEAMNLAGYIVAFMADQGFTATEIYRIYSLCVNSGVHATYSEVYDSPPDSFLPLRCDDIEYVGVQERAVPES